MTAADRLPLWDLIERRVARTPDAVMAVDERDRAITFGEYRDRCLGVAAHFARFGVTRDTPVAWMLPTWIEALVLAGGLARLGAVQVPLLPILHDREVQFILTRTGASHLVVPRRWREYDYPALAARVTADVPGAVVTVCDRSLPTAPADALASWDRVRPEGDDDPVRWIFFTSGTTSDPKGCLHTDRTVAASGHRLNLRFRMGPDDRNALVFPVTHIGGISFLFAGLLAGHRHILVETFDPERSCDVLSRHGVTIAGSGPAFWMAYVAAQRRSPGRRLFPALRALVGGGAAKPPTLGAEVREVLGVPLVSGYGSSECPGVAHCGVDDPPDVLQSDGHALDDCAIEIVDDLGGTAPPGTVGEIVVRGPMLFRGYLDPAHDAEAFDARGWLRTGDLGTLDERGVLRVTGRLKDIIIRKGENISAKEVEDVLHQHPSIADVAAIALPDATRGELCCAVVVVEEGHPPPSLDDVAVHCESLRLARQKFPERLEIVDALPRNVTGKVLKHELVARFGAVDA
jgi:acyl-CoA synthetase (AMP-forming)/AMP-acid ligase II